MSKRKYAETLAEFESELRKRSISWRLEPFEDSSGWRLRLRAWNPGRSILMLVEAYDVEPDADGEDSTHVTVAFYDRGEKHIADAGFGVTAYRMALSLVDNILRERFVLSVVRQPDGYQVAIIGPDEQVEPATLSFRRSWLGSFDFGE